MLAHIGRRADAWAARVDPWTNVYGVARTLLALGTLGTLLFSHSSSLFRPAAGRPDVRRCDGFSEISLFCQLPADRLEWARWIAIAILLVVASGWRPRITGLLHWWVAVSVTSSAVLIDGGDHVTTIFTLLLLPVTLTDRRKWHWERGVAEAPLSERATALRLIALSALVAARIQLAIVYFHAAVAKIPVEEWANGTAVYYWFTDPAMGMADWMRPVLLPVLANPIGVSLLTWGPMLLEVVLFMGLTMDRRWWKYLLIAGIGFHGGIALVHGLVSFWFAMSGALILYLRPADQPFPLPHAPPALARRSSAAPAPAAEQVPQPT